MFRTQKVKIMIRRNYFSEELVKAMDFWDRFNFEWTCVVNSPRNRWLEQRHESRLQKRRDARLQRRLERRRG